MDVRRLWTTLSLSGAIRVSRIANGNRSCALMRAPHLLGLSKPILSLLEYFVVEVTCVRAVFVSIDAIEFASKLAGHKGEQLALKIRRSARRWRRVQTRKVRHLESWNLTKSDLLSFVVDCNNVLLK